jgi:hypothetical protein
MWFVFQGAIILAVSLPIIEWGLSPPSGRRTKSLTQSVHKCGGPLALSRRRTGACEHFDHRFITRPSSPRLPFSRRTA